VTARKECDQSKLDYLRFTLESTPDGELQLGKLLRAPRLKS